MNKSDLIIIASARAQPGKEKDLERALCDVAAPTRAQPGSVQFALLRSLENPGIVVGFERWASAQHHDRHLRGPHFKKLAQCPTSSRSLRKFCLTKLLMSNSASLDRFEGNALHDIFHE